MEPISHLAEGPFQSIFDKMIWSLFTLFNSPWFPEEPILMTASFSNDIVFPVFNISKIGKSILAVLYETLSAQ